jgi:uncharacterized RDD family membrane protein YckC
MMNTIDEYVLAVDHRLPRWHPAREEILADLRAHLSDRVAAGEDESAAVAGMEDPEVYAATLMEPFALQSAPLGRRVGAFMIDILLGLPLAAGTLLLVMVLPAMISPAWPDNMPRLWLDGMRQLASIDLPLVILSTMLGITMVSALVLSIVYFPVAEAVWGTTVGKSLMGLCVVAENGTRVTWGKAIVRRLPFYFEFFWLDALFAFFSQRRLRAFDHVAGTWVVRCPR